MSTIDNYGIQYGTGDLYPKSNEGGTTDPTNVTKRRTKGNSTSFVGSTGGTELPTGNQDLLNSIQMGNLGTGAGIYGRRESNTFYFKSLVAGDGVEITSSADTIVITANGTSGGSINLVNDRHAHYLGFTNSTPSLLYTQVETANPDTWGFETRTRNMFLELSEPDPSTARNAMLVPNTLIDESETIAVEGDGMDTNLETYFSEFTGSKPYKLSIKISEDADNALELKTDGLYAAASGSGGSMPALGDTDSIHLSETNDTLLADIIVSPDADNAFEVRTNGVYVAPGVEGPQGPTGPQGPAGEKGDKGDAGTSLEFKGAADNVGQLPTTGNAEGDAWIVGSHVYIYTNGAFVDGGEIAGPQGPMGLTGEKGDKGDTGTNPNLKGTLTDVSLLPTNAPDFDAYFINGHFHVRIAGAWEDFGDLTGPQGPAGPAGAQGPIGQTGATGLPGADGTDGDVITDASINSQNHLIITGSITGAHDAGLVAYKRIRDQDDATLAPTSADNGKAIIYNSSTDKFVLGTAGGSGATTFTALTDVPSTYSSSANKVVAVNSAGTGLAFIENTDTFLELTDTPTTYNTMGGKHVRVNSGATALEFADPTFLELKDTPTAFTSAGGKALRVNSGATALEFYDAPTTFIGLTDTPSAYTGQANKIVAVNNAGTGLEFISNSGGGSASVVTVKITMSATGTFTTAGFTEIPAGWSLVSASNLDFVLQLPANSRIKIAQGYGFGQVANTWRPFSIGGGAAMYFTYTSDPTLVAFKVVTLAQTYSAANGFMILDFIL
jgi:hypothetical protein